MEEACTGSSWHGPSHVWHHRGTVWGALWLALILSCIGALLWVAFFHIREFLLREVKTQVTLARDPHDHLQLPGVVICNRDYFSKDKLQDLGININLASYLTVKLGTSFLLRWELLKGEEGRCLLQENDEALTELLRSLNVSLPELIDRISLSCEEIVAGCGYGVLELQGRECCQYMYPVHTIMGQCYFLPQYPNLKQLANLEYTGLIFYLNNVSHLVPDLNKEIVAVERMPTTGLQVSLLSNDSMPVYTVVSKNSGVTPGSLTALEVRLIKVDTSNVKTWVDYTEQPCVPTDGLSFLTNPAILLPTSPNCFLFLLYTHFSHVCSFCSPYWYQDLGLGAEKEPCSVLKETECYNRIMHRLGKAASYLPSPADMDLFGDVQCATVCESQMFDHSTLTTIIPEHIHAALSWKLGETNGLVSVVMVYYSDQQYVLHTYYREEAMLLLSKFGGFMGLLVGASLISVLEFIVYFAFTASTLITSLFSS